MKNYYSLLLFVFVFTLSGTLSAQRSNDQYSFEASYGVGLSGKPGLTELGHYEVGFRYMIDEFWGLKFDFGADKFRTDAPEGSDYNEIGTDYTRFSVQAVYNLGRQISMGDYIENTNMLAHAGLGYSSIKPYNNPGQDQTDSIGNVILGVTPQLYIIPNLALHADLSYIFNFSQHRDWDSTWHNKEEPVKGFTGGLATVSLGLTFYFGPNGSDSDWR